MAYYNKCGLLLVNDDRTKFLVCLKTSLQQYLMPGGKYDPGESDEQCLSREIYEEIQCVLDITSLRFIQEYIDIAAGNPGEEPRDVSIRLYEGTVTGVPTAGREIGALYWATASDIDNPMMSHMIRHSIIPDLIKRGLIQ